MLFKAPVESANECQPSAVRLRLLRLVRGGPVAHSCCSPNFSHACHFFQFSAFRTPLTALKYWAMSGNVTGWLAYGPFAWEKLMKKNVGIGV